MPLDRFLVPALLSLAVLTAGEALAYVPPSEFIVKNWAQKHVTTRGVRVRAWVQEMDGDHPDSIRFKLQAVARMEDGVVRWTAQDEQGATLYIDDDRSEGPYASLLFNSNAAHIIRVLKSAGIPIKSDETPENDTLSLGRTPKQVAWVIGKKGSDSAPQFWIEKDTFLPVKLKISSGQALFENYRFFRDFPFPRMVTWFEGKNAIFRQELTDLTLNPPELSQLKGPTSRGFTEAGYAAPSSVRDLIQKFFEKAH